MRIVNRGDKALEVAVDPRLFWFEITPPDRRHSRKRQALVCRLPNPLFPSTVLPELVVRLEPGEGAVQDIDPRAYCSPRAGARPFVPGALVVSHFGWPESTRSGRRSGRQFKTSVEQSPPFVAKLAEPSQTADQRESFVGQAKQLVAAPFELPAAYAAETVREPRAPALELVTVSGSDASTKRQVEVTLAVRNRSAQSQRVFLRREQLTFQVHGRDGVVICDAEPDRRHPSPMAFKLLRPGSELRVASRLYELCPVSTFDHAGTYLIFAYFDATHNGIAYGLAAFTGRIFTHHPALVRVLSGPSTPPVPLHLLRFRDH